MVSIVKPDFADDFLKNTPDVAGDDSLLNNNQESPDFSGFLDFPEDVTEDNSSFINNQESPDSSGFVDLLEDVTEDNSSLINNQEILDSSGFVDLLEDVTEDNSSLINNQEILDSSGFVDFPEDVTEDNSSSNSLVIINFVGSFRDNTQYVTGDVDRDGDADLIEVSQDGGLFKSTTWINDGLGSFNNIGSIDFVGDFRDNTQYVTGDVDRDGAADLIEVWQDGGLFKSTTWINDGLGSFNIGSIDFVGDFRDNTQYVTEDVNQDGAADLIELWQDGGVFNTTNWINDGLGSFNIGSIDPFLGTPIPLI
ncbi:VCBS repeat-containing protein [Nostoc sp. FACHB-888]|uniref:FG-GAP repeat domain-containing protein n=1 Tax=Nostoc sp. FACHB-888 TaxID=2692842 RepID=UPI0016826384|nr:VCBS repeat-containing protein [Nostoc sp. FACHB-888]MBD2242454.1 VCBS repeat-containing protein [Nostoc sp. FACHB-888]